MLLILKIPIVYLCVVVWCAIKAEPSPPELAGGRRRGRHAAGRAARRGRRRRTASSGRCARTPRPRRRLAAPAREGSRA